MQNKVVLDSCIFNKLFLQEADREQAINLITELTKRKYQVLVPSLFLYEVLTIASVNNFATQKAYDLITQYQQANLELVELDQACILKAIEICETGHAKSGFPSFYDASYHALAIVNNCTFITADNRHVSKTLQFGHIVLLKNWSDVFS
jgi:predicted nucleic acid-binding protein